MQCNERMHPSRGAKTTPDLNIHGKEEKGKTKVSLPLGSDIFRGKSHNSEKHNLVFLPSADELQVFICNQFLSEKSSS